MTLLNDPALLVVAMITAGLGLTMAASDWGSRSSRAMAAFLVILGVDMAFDANHAGTLARCVSLLLDACTFWAGIEWANRIGENVSGRRRRAATVLFRMGQLLILAFAILGLVYEMFINPEGLGSDGLVRATGLEFALFAPLIGSAMLLVIIAGFLLSSTRMDRADVLRLRMLGLASPFLISGLILEQRVVPFTMGIGILVLCAGAIRYLMIQSRRGQFMSQFLAPEVAELVRREGMERVMRRERRVLSVVVCDLRGFTAYARENDSDQVISLLERFYTEVGNAAAAYGGTIKDHAGDGVLLLVGAPIACADHAHKALLLAGDIMVRGQRLLHESGLQGTVGLGLGVATGQVTVGTIRGAGQLEYLAVGNAVNLAARLCDRAADGQILADTRTTDNATEQADTETAAFRATAQAPEPLKGFSEPIAICAVEVLHLPD